MKNTDNAKYLILAFCVVLSHGCNKKADEPKASIPSVAPITATTPQITNRSYQVTFKVISAPPQSLITYTHKSNAESVKAGSPWEKTISAVGGDYVSVYCMPPAEMTGKKVLMTSQILVDGKVFVEKTTEGMMAECTIPALPIPTGYATPTPSREELEQRIRNLEERQDQSEDDRQKEQEERDAENDKASRSAQQNQLALDYHNRKIEDLMRRRDELERSKANNLAPDEVQKQIDSVDEDIRDQRSQVREIESR